MSVLPEALAVMQGKVVTVEMGQQEVALMRALREAPVVSPVSAGKPMQADWLVLVI
jgi:hypothetical protein